MRKIKLIAEQTFLLTFLIMVIMGVEGFISYLCHDPLTFSWHIPFSVIFVSFLCCLPTLIFFTEKPLTKLQLKLLKLVHFFLIYAIVMGAGRLFNWYSTMKYFLITSLAVLINYVLVWTFSSMLQKYDEKLINEALSTIQDED